MAIVVMREADTPVDVWHWLLTGQNDIRLPENTCGAIVAMDYDESYSGVKAYVSAA